MKPRVHTEVRSLRHRIDLIAQRVNNSILYPQKTEDGKEYMVRRLAKKVTAGCAANGVVDEICGIQRVFDFVKGNVDVAEDPADYDLFMSVGNILEDGAADCDDHVIIVNSMLSSIGYRTGARITSSNGTGWHIYSIVGVDPAFNGTPTAVIPMDTRYGERPGWEPDERHRQIEYQCTFVKGRTVGWMRNR